MLVKLKRKERYRDILGYKFRPGKLLSTEIKRRIVDLYLSGEGPRQFILMVECVASFVIIKRLSRVNVTGLLCRLQVKIENIYLFKIIIKSIETSLKTGFAQIFSFCRTNLSCPNLVGVGAAAPLAPPARTRMTITPFYLKSAAPIV